MSAYMVELVHIAVVKYQMKSKLVELYATVSLLKPL